MSEPGDLVAADVMQKSLVCTEPNEKLANLQPRLVEAHVSGMPVVEDDRLIGVISRSDFVRIPVLMDALCGYARDELKSSGPLSAAEQTAQAESRGLQARLEQLTVREVMPHQVVTCSPQTPLVEVAAKMVHRHIHRVIVVEQDRPLGIVSSLDLVKLMIKEKTND